MFLIRTQKYDISLYDEFFTRHRPLNFSLSLSNLDASSSIHFIPWNRIVLWHLNSHLQRHFAVPFYDRNVV